MEAGRGGQGRPAGRAGRRGSRWEQGAMQRNGTRDPRSQPPRPRPPHAPCEPTPAPPAPLLPAGASSWSSPGRRGRRAAAARRRARTRASPTAGRWADRCADRTGRPSATPHNACVWLWRGAGGGQRPGCCFGGALAFPVRSCCVSVSVIAVAVSAFCLQMLRQVAERTLDLGAAAAGTPVVLTPAARPTAFSVFCLPPPRPGPDRWRS